MQYRVRNTIALVLIGIGIGWFLFEARGLCTSTGVEPAEDVSLPGIGEMEMKALARAYPERIIETAYRKGDWALRIDDTWYYWAEGRILPEEQRNAWIEYAPFRFYPYPKGLPPLRVLTNEEKQVLQERLHKAEKNPPRRNEAFLSHLFHASDQQETEANLVTVRFFGFSVRLHKIAAEPLLEVEKDLRSSLESDPEIQRFFSSLTQIGGYNWRPIAGTASRSYHSYGLALDFIPKSWEGKHSYWRDSQKWEEEWFSIPYEDRWMIPLAIVEAFEKHGFIWGGKWLYFDTMHFEYRPELFILQKEREGSTFR